MIKKNILAPKFENREMNNFCIFGAKNQKIGKENILGAKIEIRINEFFRGVIK